MARGPHQARSFWGQGLSGPWSSFFTMVKMVAIATVPFVVGDLHAVLDDAFGHVLGFTLLGNFSTTVNLTPMVVPGYTGW